MNLEAKRANLKTRILAVAVCALFAFGAMALASCGGQSDEEKIKGLLTTELEAMKNLDDNMIDEIVSDEDLASFEDYGVDAKEFVRGYLAGFDYSIGDIKVDGDTAEVTLTLTCRDGLEWSNAFTEALEGVLDDAYAQTDSPSEEDISKLIGPAIMSSLQDSQIKTLDPTTVWFSKASDGSWESDGLEDEIAGAMFSGF